MDSEHPRSDLARLILEKHQLLLTITKEHTGFETVIEDLIILQDEYKKMCGVYYKVDKHHFKKNRGDGWGRPYRM